MKLRDLSVRHRLTLNNAIMVFVPVLLLVIIGSTVFYGCLLYTSDAADDRV